MSIELACWIVGIFLLVLVVWVYSYWRNVDKDIAERVAFVGAFTLITLVLLCLMYYVVVAFITICKYLILQI